MHVDEGRTVPHELASSSDGIIKNWSEVIMFQCALELLRLRLNASTLGVDNVETSSL